MTSDNVMPSEAHPTPHSAKIRIEDSHWWATYECRAEPGAPCRMGCSASACDHWESDGCVHGPLTDQGYCLVVEWLTNQDREGSLSGETIVYDGPIQTEWTGDGYQFEPIAAMSRDEPQSGD